MQNYFLDFCKTFAFFPTGNEFGKVKKIVDTQPRHQKKGWLNIKPLPTPLIILKMKNDLSAAAL